MKIYFGIFFFITLTVSFISCDTSPVAQCHGQAFENLQERIQISPCGKLRCRLPKGTNATVTFQFTTNRIIRKLFNDVHAEVAGLPLPFVGVDGTNACAGVKRAEDGAPAPCPLLPNQEYTYSTSISIEHWYPLINLRVHWALVDGRGDNVICFEVPAVIIGKKKS